MGVCEKRNEEATYSIVIPCYNCAATIQTVVELSMQEMQGKTVDFILVNDASDDNGQTLEKLEALVRKYPNVIVIDLAKNAGQHNAVLAGLHFAQGDFLIAMDDDLQTHPSQIHKLMDKIGQGYDIVYAYYPQKKHAWYRNIGSRINSWTVRTMIGKPKGLETSSFWIIRKFIRDNVIQYRHAYAYMQGLFLRTTQNIACIPVEHFERAYGKSNYSFKKLVLLWSNMIGFSVVPLRMASVCGCLFSAAGICGAVLIGVRKVLFHTAIEGWTSLMAAVCFFSGMILLFMGLTGEYIGRMFLSGNYDPQYVIRSVSGNGGRKEDEETDDSGSRHLSGSADQTGKKDGDLYDRSQHPGELSGICVCGQDLL